MTWHKELKAALEGGQPIVLDLAFDPGWENLRLEFEQKASARQTSRETSRVLKEASHRFSFQNTAEALAIANRIYGYDPAALERTYIFFENDVRSYKDFVAGKNGGRLTALRDRFQILANGVSHLNSAERYAFVDELDCENEENKFRRALSFPSMVYFTPCWNSRNKGMDDDRILLDTGLSHPERKDDEIEFISMIALDVKDQKLRQMLLDGRGRKAVVGTLYIRREDFRARIESVREGDDPMNKFGLLQMKVNNIRQICTRIPPHLDEDFDAHSRGRVGQNLALGF